jgi:hypothetical protein
LIYLLFFVTTKYPVKLVLEKVNLSRVRQKIVKYVSLDSDEIYAIGIGIGVEY